MPKSRLRQAVGGDAAGHVHFDSTSQDAIDTSLMLRLKTILSIFAGRKEMYRVCCRGA